MRISQRGDLDAVAREHGAAINPAILGCLPVELGPGIGRRDRNLNGEWIELLGEADRLVDSLLRLDGETNNKCPMHPDPELAAVLHELPRGVEIQSFLDTVQ